MSYQEQACGELSLRAWNLMGGEINWSALPVVVELLGIDDVPLLMTNLVAIRDHLERQAKANG